MQKQLSLLDHIPGNLAGLVPSVRAAMNRAAGEDEQGRKLLLDRLNNLAAEAGIRLTSGSAKAISKDTLDKWLAPADRDHTPSLLAVACFCVATNHEPLRVLLRALGLDVMTAEDRKARDYGLACMAEREARKRKRKLEDGI